MEEELILFSEAQEMKNLGFDEPCYEAYNIDGVGGESSTPAENYNYRLDVISRPTYSQCWRWFRKNYLLDGLILPQEKGARDPLPRYFIAVECYQNDQWTEPFNSSDSSNEKTFLHYFEYEDAEAPLLKKLIELAKKMKL
jgi:hypothetical protein